LELFQFQYFSQKYLKENTLTNFMLLYFYYWETICQPAINHSSSPAEGTHITCYQTTHHFWTHGMVNKVSAYMHYKSSSILPQNSLNSYCEINLSTVIPSPLLNCTHSVLHITFCVEMTCDSYTVIHVQYKCQNYGEDSGINFRLQYSKIEKIIHIIINKYRHTELLLNKNEQFKMLTH
jgi:hypothetical protein